MKVGVCVQFSSMDEMSKKFKSLVDNGLDNFQLIARNSALRSRLFGAVGKALLPGTSPKVPRR